VAEPKAATKQPAPPPPSALATAAAKCKPGDKLGQESPNAGDPPGPAKLTLYLCVPLSNGMPDVTGVYFPEKYVPGATMDVILYLQGKRDKGQCGGSPNDTIDVYWKNKDFFLLREGLNNTGRNFVLVAPSLSAGSRSGAMMEDGGADRYLKTVLDGVAKADPFKLGWKPSGLSAGNVILAAHSGGGWTMSHVAGSIKAGNVPECWALDAMYDTASVPLWLQWAGGGGKLWVYYLDAVKHAVELDQKVAANQHLKNLGNVQVIDATREAGDHCKVPITYWEKRIKAAPSSKAKP
jgi:hypothetical protein